MSLSRLSEHSRRPWRHGVIGLTVLIWFAGVPGSDATAQLPRTRLYSLFPPGGRAGTTFDVTITSGGDLDEVDTLYFNHPGIKAVQKMKESRGRKEPVANTFTVTVDPNVPAGLYEVRAGGLYGVSNPRTFVVGLRKETLEAEPNNTPDQAGTLELGSVLNGRAGGAADVDVFKFRGKKGQRVIATCQAARIDSRMDAVIEVLDASGRRLAYGRHQVRRDPLVDVTLPADAEYFLKVSDLTYRGGNEYVYRLTAHTGPHIDYIMPPAGVPNTTAPYTLYGRNLPGGQPAAVSLDGRPLEKLTVKISLPPDPSTLQAIDNLTAVEAGIDGITYVLRTSAGDSNPMLVQFATAAVVLEREPNNVPQQANKLTVPGEFAGQFQAKGDIDYVTFEAKSGDIYYVEVFGQRNGTTADPYFILEQVTTDSKGVERIKRITAQDDNGTNLAANIFDTITDDPVFRFQVPADGHYRISLRDRYFEARGNARLVYRLAIRKAQPDFRLVVLPYTSPVGNNKSHSTSAIGLRKGDNFAAQVMAFRRDGLGGTIDVTAEGLPTGVTCKGASIGPGQNSAWLIFSAAENAPEWFGHIRVVGKASCGDPVKQVSRPARTATIVWNSAQNVPAVSRVSRSLGLSVLKEPAPYQVTTDVFRVEANQGRQILIPVKLVKRTGFDNNVSLTFVGLPKNSRITAQNKPIKKGANQELLRLFVNNNAPASVYSVYLKAQAQVSYRRNPDQVERVKAEQAAAAKLAAAAANAAKQAAQTRDAAVKKAAADATALKNATTAKSNAERPSKATADAATTAALEKTKAEKAATDAAAVAKAAVNKATAAKKATKADADAEKAAAVAAAAAKKAADTKIAADKKFAEAQAAAKKAADALAAAEKARQTAALNAKASAKATAKAEAAAKAADAKSKAAAAAKAAVDKKLTAAVNAAKPKNLNVSPPSTPIVITVKKAPATLTAAVPGGGNLKRGAKLAVKVTVKRINGFQGPVALTLPLPPGVAGLSAAPVTVPAGKNDGVLTVQAAGNATEGQLANLVVRGTMAFEGQAAVDVPIAVKVSK